MRLFCQLANENHIFVVMLYFFRQVCWILESSSNVSLLNDKDQNGKTPLDYAMSEANLP